MAEGEAGGRADLDGSGRARRGGGPAEAWRACQGGLRDTSGGRVGRVETRAPARAPSRAPRPLATPTGRADGPAPHAAGANLGAADGGGGAAARRPGKSAADAPAGAISGDARHAPAYSLRAPEGDWRAKAAIAERGGGGGASDWAGWGCARGRAGAATGVDRLRAARCRWRPPARDDVDSAQNGRGAEVGGGRWWRPPKGREETPPLFASDAPVCEGPLHLRGGL